MLQKLHRVLHGSSKGYKKVNSNRAYTGYGLFFAAFGSRLHCSFSCMEHIWTHCVQQQTLATKLYLALYFCSVYLCITAGTKLAWQSIQIIFHYAHRRGRQYGQLIKIVWSSASFSSSTWYATWLSGPRFPIGRADATVGQSLTLFNAPRVQPRQKFRTRTEIGGRRPKSPSRRNQIFPRENQASCVLISRARTTLPLHNHLHCWLGSSSTRKEGVSFNNPGTTRMQIASV